MKIPYFIRQMLARRRLRKGWRAKRKLLSLIPRLDAGHNLSEDEIKGRINYAAGLIRECANQLTTNEVYELGDLRVTANMVVRYEDCGGACNVAGDSAHLGPCLCPNGKYPIYENAVVDCQPIKAEVEKILVWRRKADSYC